MPERNAEQRLEDIREACRKILRYADGKTFLDPVHDERDFDAIVRNIEIVGEAAKHIPEETRSHYAAIEWTLISGMRDRLAHGYFDVDPEIVWQVICEEIPILLKTLA